MTTLSERLARGRAPETAAAGAHRDQPGVPRRAVRLADPFAEVKRSVHEGLLETLGPKLYDAHLDQRCWSSR
jgi:hypothetical protein